MPKCKTDTCDREARAKGLCNKCYHAQWMAVQRSKKQAAQNIVHIRERYASDLYWQRNVKLLESAYKCAVTVEARLRIRGELEALRKAAN